MKCVIVFGFVWATYLTFVLADTVQISLRLNMEQNICMSHPLEVFQISFVSQLTASLFFPLPTFTNGTH